MLKICSFFPAATTMIQQLGLEEHLFGVTFECPSDKPAIIRSHIEGHNMSSLEIDQTLSDYHKKGEYLYYIDEELLQDIAPDIIITQDVCEVCQIGTSKTRSAIAKLKKQPKIISLNPRNLQDVYQNAQSIAKALDKEKNAVKLLLELNNRTTTITNKLQANKAPTRTVLVVEWIDPLYCCGHWIPDQIKFAGGNDLFAKPEGYSSILTWDKVLKYNPEVIVIAPCGFNIDRASSELKILTSKTGWQDLKAVKNNEVYLADADLFTQPSTKLVDGIELLAHLFHPQIFKYQEAFKNIYTNINQL